MTQGYIGIGSNIDREQHIADGLQDLRNEFGNLKVSGVYESAPIGFAGDAFYNLVVGFDTTLTADAVVRKLRAIEVAHGRPADSKKFSSRTLDLDLLLLGDRVIDNGRLKLPRDDIVRYPFVLQPLAEIAPTQRHPVLQQSFAELWQRMAKTAGPLKRVEFVDGRGQDSMLLT